MKMIRYITGISLLLYGIVSLFIPSQHPNIHQANPLLVPIIMGLITLASTGAQMATQSKSRKEMKTYQKQLERRNSDYQAWFDSEYKRDFLDTEQGRSTLNQLGMTLKNTLNNNQNAAVRTGATAETQVAAQGQAQDVFAQALNQLTSQGTQYKQNLRNSYDYNIQNYLRPLDALQTGKVANWNQLGGQIGDSGAGLITALGSIDWENI